jgi:alpha-L-rhamnosidase
VLGVGTPTPRLSWAIPQAEQGFEQTAYEIELARGEGPPSSVVVESREQVLVPWTAEPLTSRESVQVRVRVRGDAEWSDWSQPTVVTAGLLSVDNWTA